MTIFSMNPVLSEFHLPRMAQYAFSKPPSGGVWSRPKMTSIRAAAKQRLRAHEERARMLTLYLGLAEPLVLREDTNPRLYEALTLGVSNPLDVVTTYRAEGAAGPERTTDTVFVVEPWMEGGTLWRDGMALCRKSVVRALPTRWAFIAPYGQEYQAFLVHAPELV